MAVFSDEEDDEYISLEQIGEDEDTFIFKKIKKDHFILKNTKEFIEKFNKIESFTWFCDIECPEELMRHVWKSGKLRTFHMRTLDFPPNFFDSYSPRLFGLTIDGSNIDRKDLLKMIEENKKLAHLTLKNCEINRYTYFCLALENRKVLLEKLHMDNVQFIGTRYPDCETIVLERMNYPETQFSVKTEAVRLYNHPTKYEMEKILLNKDTHAPKIMSLFFDDDENLDTILKIFIQSFKQIQSLQIINPEPDVKQKTIIQSIESGYFKTKNTVELLKLKRIGFKEVRFPEYLADEVFEMLHDKS